jgi:hypothetical protein
MRRAGGSPRPPAPATPAPVPFAARTPIARQAANPGPVGHGDLRHPQNPTSLSALAPAAARSVRTMLPGREIGHHAAVLFVQRDLAVHPFADETAPDQTRPPRSHRRNFPSAKITASNFRPGLPRSFRIIPHALQHIERRLQLTVLDRLKAKPLLKFRRIGDVVPRRCRSAAGCPLPASSRLPHAARSPFSWILTPLGV